MDRKVIFKARVGSHLHGTATPTSDEDYLGVYLPSVEEMIGLENRPKEWTDNIKVTDGVRNSVGDVDCKYLPLYVFLKQAGYGDSQSLELLFVPDEHIITQTEEWSKILDHRDSIVSRDSILPFIGFAKAQAHKAVIKGANLNLINNLIDACDKETSAGHGNMTILSSLQWYEGDSPVYLLGYPVKLYENGHGVKLVKIANRDYDLGVPIKRLAKSLRSLESKYGIRTRSAAKDIYDYKSVTHAFRLCGEAQEILTSGSITFPRPDKKFLKDVKLGNYNGGLDEDIEKRLDILRELRDNSSLRSKPDWKKINKLCQNMILEYWKC